MKAIFLTGGSDGDIHPHLALASEMRSRGHDVVFLATFEYIELARSLGLRAIPTIDSGEKAAFLEVHGNQKPLTMLRTHFNFFAEKIADTARLAANEIDDDTVIISPLSVSGVARLLHDHYGTPYVSTLLTPADLISMSDPPFYKSLRPVLGLPYWLRRHAFGLVERGVFDPLCRSLLKYAAKSFNRKLPRRMYSRWLFSPQCIVGLFPEWLCKRPSDWPENVTLTGFPLYRNSGAAHALPERLLQFLDAGPPPVAVTVGTTETEKSRSFFETAIAALQGAGQRGILLSRLTQDQMPPLPEGITLEPYLSLDLLLPRVGAFLHHGGIGTAALALSAGVPQLMLPNFTNQTDNARRIAALGCGVTLERDRGVEALTAALKTLVSPESIERCRAVQQLTEPGERARARAADVIERVARQARRPALAAA